MYRVALTGGIGSGKSTVAALFERQGAAIVDADAISHALTAPGGEALPAIAAAFGDGLIDAEGRLDRAALRRTVFADPNARKRLEDILHPLIRRRMLAEAEDAAAPYAMLVIPLLFETGQQRLVQRVLVVGLPEAQQIARTKTRSGLSEAEVRQIIASQVTPALRIAGADDVIDNSGRPEDLLPRVASLHRLYVGLADLYRRGPCPA